MTSVEGLLAQAERSAPAIWSRRSCPALDQVTRDYNHYRRALDTFISRGDAEHAARFVAALRDFWWTRGLFAEGMLLIDRVLALPGLSPASHATVLDQAGALAFAEAKYASARQFFQSSVDLRRTDESPRALALALNHLGAAVRWGSTDGANARAVYEESLALATEIGDQLLIAAALMPLGTLALDRSAVDEADELLRDGMAIYVELRLETAYPLALEQFAAVAAARGEAVRALRLAAAGAVWRRRLDTNQTPYPAWLESYLSRATLALKGTDVHSACLDGEAMTLKEAIDYALRDDRRRGIRHIRPKTSV